MRAAEKWQELNTAMLNEKLGAIEISQEEFVGS
jgi:hypothetical protein